MILKLHSGNNGYKRVFRTAPNTTINGATSYSLEQAIPLVFSSQDGNRHIGAHGP